MAENRFISEKKEKQGKTLFARIEKLTGVTGLSEKGLPVQYFIRLLFAFILALIYIWNTHSAERKIRDIARLEKEIEDLRADYTTMKAEFMFAGKQSEVARKVNSQGVVESQKPPYKIKATK